MRVAIFTGLYRYPASMEEPVVAGSLVGPFYLSRGLVKLGSDVHVFSPGTSEDEAYSTFDGVKIHRYIPTKLRSLPGFLVSDFERYKLFLKENRKGRFEIIQTQSPLFFELSHAKRNKLPIVFTDHGSPINCLIDLPPSWLGVVRKMTTRFFSQPLYEFTCRNAEKIVLISKELFRNSEKELGFKVSNEKLELIHNGVDTNHFSPREVGDLRNKIEYNENILVYVGRISHEKGIHNVLKILPKILDYHSSTTFLIVGAPISSFKNYIEILRKLIEKEKIQKHVIFHLNVPEEDLPKFYSLGDVQLVPSINYDPFPNAIFEGMACGLPVISTDFEPRREIITNNETGFLFPEGDSVELKNCILSALSDKRRLKKMGKNSRKIMMEKYDITLTAKKYLKLYKDLVEAI